VEAGVPTSWGTGSDVEDQALAGRLARLIAHYADEEEARAAAAAPAREPASAARERAQADLARLRGLLLELGSLAEAAGALAAHLGDSLAVSYLSDDFSEAQEARQALAGVGALCATLRRTAADAQEWAAGIDVELPGLRTTDQF